MDAARRDRTHLIARTAGSLVLVGGFVHIITHWTALSATPAIEGKRFWDQLLGTAEVALAVRLSVLAGALYLLASVVGQSDRLGRLENAWERSEETDPDGEAYDG